MFQAIAWTTAAHRFTKNAFEEPSPASQQVVAGKEEEILMSYHGNLRGERHLSLSFFQSVKIIVALYMNINFYTSYCHLRGIDGCHHF